MSHLKKIGMIYGIPIYRDVYMERNKIIITKSEANEQFMICNIDDIEKILNMIQRKDKMKSIFGYEDSSK